MKKLRSLVAAVVAVACLYTPTAAADPLSVELNALDSTIQVDGMAGNQPDGDAADGDQPDDNGVVESDGGALTSGSGEPTVESEGADTVPEGADATPGEGDGAADDGPTADTPQAVDWTNAVDNLRLSTQGLTITPSVPADGETDADIAGTSVIPEGLNGSGVSRGAALGGLAESQPEQQAKEGAAQLPDAIDATLNLTFTLDAAAGDGRTDGSGLGTIVAGDHFSVPMPEGLATADEGSALDVFARDTDGNTTTVRVAEAKASDGVLTVTFTEPADAQAREAVTASIDMPVTLDAALVQDEVSAIEWTVRTVEDAEGNRQPETLTINVPAKSDVMKTLGLVGTQDPESKENGESADKTDDASDKVEKPKTISNAAEPLADNALSSESTYELSGNTSMQLEVTWCDNNYSGRPKATDMKGYIPQFSSDAGKTWEPLFVAGDNKELALSQDAIDAFHIDLSNPPAWAKPASVSVNQSALNTYTVSVSGLPESLETTVKYPLDADGDGVQDTDANGTPQWDESKTATTTMNFTWQWSDTNTYPDEYQFGRNDSLTGEESHRYLMLTDTVTFTVDGRIGGESLSSIFKDAQAPYFQFGAQIDNQDQGSSTLSDLIASDGKPTTEWPLILEDNGTTATITGTLPLYDENGDPIVYYIKYNGPSPENTGDDAPQYTDGADYFQVSYNNAASASHGSATDAVYSGGTMVLRRMGTATYDATKVWLDNGNKGSRPATSFTLWRYALRDGSDATTASQVQLNALDGNALEYVSIDVPEQSGETVGGVDNAVDLGALLEDKYGEEAVQSLPKYDPDGYPYIYALREEGAPKGYEIVYGSVDKDGTTTDTGPNYEKADYAGNSNEREPDGYADYKKRPSDDPLVYNGGTITNRITGQTEVSATKTWEISAFQDDLSNVTTTFQLQSRVKGSADDADWTDVKGDNATHTETGWQSETLTRTFSGTFPEYNALGEELEYRWVESDVTIDGQNTGFKRDGKGGGTFTLTLPVPDEDEPETLKFTSTFKAAENEGETDAITNTFENTTEEYVEKWWQQPDGSMAQIKPDPNGYPEYPDIDTSGKVAFNLFQDGVQVGSFTMDGTSNDPQPIYKEGTEESGVAEGFDKATWAETGSYDVTLANLPKYSPEGKRYSYLVLEEAPDGWSSRRVYDEETHTTIVRNAVGPGEASEIRAMKQWVDGDDAAHRLPVVAKLVATSDMQSQATDPDTGEPLYSYQAGETVSVYPEDPAVNEGVQLTDTFLISADSAWFTEVYVPIGYQNYNDFKLVEVGLLRPGADPANYTNADILPAVDNSEEAIAAYGDDTVWANVGWNYDSTQNTSRVANDEHVYETLAGEQDEPQRNDDLEAVVASNRRIGLFDLTVKKDWKDGGDAENRPDAQLVLSSTEYPDAFSIDDAGNVWVQVSDNRLPVNVPTGPNDTDRRQLNATTDNVSLNDDGGLVMQIDTSADDDGLYQFFGLPKYDAFGAVVHYDVTEEWVGDHTGYTSSKSVGDYVVGTQHFHDTQTITFTNRRTGTRDVTFYKQWKDFYVNDELNQRPDIYLTLYRVTEERAADGSITYSDPEQVPGYVHWLWQGTESDNPQYDQMSTISGLPAYDGEGCAYIYYASESMAADATSLDYDAVKFDYGSIDKAKAEAEQNKEAYPGGENAVRVSSNIESTDPTQNGADYAIHEDGTFVNSLTSKLVARGTKLWDDVPGNVVQTADRSDLPQITVYLQRRLPGEDWPLLKFDVTADGTWSIVNNGEGKNPGAIAWTSDLTYETANQYSYTIQYEGPNTAGQTEGTPLDRYTDKGEMYEYRAIEVTWGLLGQPGGFTAADVEKTDFSQLRDGKESPLPGVVVIDHGETGSFRLQNTYDSPTGSLTVKKLFAGRDADDLYPSTTFDVYRYYVNEQGQKSTAERVATHTLTNAELSAATTDENANPRVTASNPAGNNTAEYTFSGLDIYAPDGSYWQYYMVERAINGYTTTVGIGDLDAGAVTDSGTQRDNPATGTSSKDLCEGGEATVGDDGASAYVPITGTVLAEDTENEDGTVTSNDTTVDVTFLNTYKPDPTSIDGAKEWADYDNIFNVRPEIADFIDGLTITRAAGGKTETLSTGAADDDLKLTIKPEAEVTDGEWKTTPNLLTYSENDNNIFSFKLSNVEKYAPNGQAWTYAVKETADAFKDYYSVVAGEDSVSTSNTGDTFELRNALRGQASVTKSWKNKDGSEDTDPWGLRPDTVTMRLQARVTLKDSGTTAQPGAWGDAYTVLQQFASQSDIDIQFGNGFFEKQVTSNSGWSTAWSGLPILAKVLGGTSLQADQLYTIEYRVVEVAIGGQDISDKVNNYTGGNSKDVYDTGVYPYQPAQTGWKGNAQNGWNTAITNTLDDTNIAATKTWSGDQNDNWATRPDNGSNKNQWQATFFLQRSTDGATWEWVVEAGANPATSATSPGVVSVTITDQNTSNSQTATWEHLPRANEQGVAYRYRVVEQVPGSYDVIGAEQVTDTDTAHRYYVVPVTEATGDNPSSQFFTNTLRTVNLTGTKAWVDWDDDSSNNPAFDASKAPKLTLYRSIQTGTDGTTGKATWSDPERVKQNGSPAQQPDWTDANNDGVWEFTYTSLPAANENDQPYVYWAEEQVGTDGIGGYYPLYQYGEDGQSDTSQDAAGTTVDVLASPGTAGRQTNESITNVAAKLSLDKVSNWLVENGGQNDWEQLTNIELSIQSRDGKTTYATWANGTNGTSYDTYTWIGGTPTADVDSTKDNAAYRNDNLIVGLKAGEYKLVETGTVPDGYAKALEVYFKIETNGKATFAGVYLNGKRLDTSTDPVTSVSDVVVTDDNGVQTINLTAQDPVLRGHLQLTKYVSDDGTADGSNRVPLQGATFDLYLKDVDGDRKDELIASGLTSNASGVVATKDSTIEMNHWSSKGYDSEGNELSDPVSVGAKDLTHGSKYGVLRDGLPEGKYYFVETDATTGAVMPSDDAAKSSVFEITQENHFAYTNAAVSQTMENEDFSATVMLHKFDTETTEPIQGATFQVKYAPEAGSHTSHALTWTESTDANGVLTLDGLEKGSYTVTEQSNTGYVNNGFTATFTIDEADDDKTYDITTTDKNDEDVKATGFEVTEGTLFVNGRGIPNVPERGSVTIEKVSSVNNTTKLNGATFELQRMNGTDWTTTAPDVVAKGLVTDRSYAMTEDNTALADPDGTEITDSDGRITVSNLKWGTYRFVETAPKPGYTGVKGEGSQATAVTSSDLVVGRTSLNPSLTGDKAVKNTPTSLELNKRNEDGQALAGAKFTVTPVDGSAFADPTAMGADYDAATGAITLTTNGSGLATLKAQLIVGGTYEIYESKAPTGYDPVDETFRVSVQNDGTLAVVGGEDNLPDRYDRYGDEGFSFIATNDHLAIKLQKVSAADHTVKLEGVQYTLVGPCMANPDPTSSHPFTTDANGEISIDIGLLGGVEYKLSELNTPDGYVRMTDVWHFMINDRGEIETYPGTTRPDEITVNGDRISITAENKPVNLQITKRAPAQEDGTPGKTLEGAEFTVTPADGSTFANKVDGSKTNPRTITIGSEGVASMTAELVVGGTYDITETEAPKGYEKVGGTMRITVDTDGTINVLGSVADDGTVNPQAPAGYTKVSGNAFEVQVENQPIEIGLVKVEADNTATVLAGAEFGIQGVFADSPGRPEIRTFTTNADGTLIYQGATLDNLSEVFVGGTEYTLVEAQAPAGYTLIADPWTFTVTEGGEIETSDPLAAPGESGFAIGADKVTIMAMDESVEASLVKTGIDGPSADTMVGAKFTLTGDFVNDEHDVIEGRTLTLTTGVDGTLNLFGMKDLADPNDQHTYGLIADNGEYVLTEIEAPQGYEVIEEPFTFTVGTDGRLSPVSAQADAGTEGYTLTAAGARITATDTPIRVRLQKAGSDTDGGLLDGATFTLSRVTADADGGESETVLDDDIAPTAAGAVELTGLVGGGTYRLHESEAPAGYELMDDLTFTVDANGEVAIADNGQWAAASADGTVTITATDPAIEVMFDKRDLDGNLLPGAVFQIEGRFVNDATRALDAEPRTLALTMGESGTLALKGMADEDGATYSLVAGQRYMLTEATAPNGYEVIGPFEFTVNPDGTVTAEPGREAAEGEPGYRLSNGEDGVVSVTAFDGPIEVVLYKQSAEGEPLSGAEFRIEGRFVDEATHVLDAEPRAIDLRMDGDSLVLAGMVSGGSTYGLVAGGQYVLTETKAPAGYELIEGGVAFVVGANGTIMATGPNYPFYTVSLSSAEVSITAHDDPIELAIAKVDENGKPLEGAEFMITGDFVGPDGTVEAGSRTVAPGTDPVVVDGFVADGEYVIAETKAPEGYAQVEDVTFVVNADGTITLTSGNADGSYTVSDEDERGIVTISVTNERIPEMSTTGSGTAPATLLAVALLSLGAAIALQRRTMPAGSARGRHRR